MVRRLRGSAVRIAVRSRFSSRNCARHCRRRRRLRRIRTGSRADDARLNPADGPKRVAYLEGDLRNIRQPMLAKHFHHPAEVRPPSRRGVRRASVPVVLRRWRGSGRVLENPRAVEGAAPMLMAAQPGLVEHAFGGVRHGDVAVASDGIFIASTTERIPARLTFPENPCSRVRP